MRFVISRSSVRIRRVAPRNSQKSKTFSAANADITAPTSRIVRIVSAFVKGSDIFERPVQIENLRVAHLPSAILGWRLTFDKPQIDSRAVRTRACSLTRKTTVRHSSRARRHGPSALDADIGRRPAKRSVACALRAPGVCRQAAEGRGRRLYAEVARCDLRASRATVVPLSSIWPQSGHEQPVTAG